MEVAAVQTPMSINNPADVKIEKIPLPPRAMWDELDNSAPAKSVELKPAARLEVPQREQEALNFVGGNWKKTIPLDFPFEHPALGLVSEIVVRRLTVGEVGEVFDVHVQSPDNFDLYARMTGVPAAVLRGLMDSDGAEVSRVCYDFLPRVFKPQMESDSAPSSAATSGGQ